MGDEGLESPPENTEETAFSSTSSPTSSPTAAPADLGEVLQVLLNLDSERLQTLLRLSELVSGR